MSPADAVQRRSDAAVRREYLRHPTGFAFAVAAERQRLDPIANLDPSARHATRHESPHESVVLDHRHQHPERLLRRSGWGRDALEEDIEERRHAAAALSARAGARPRGRDWRRPRARRRDGGEIELFVVRAHGREEVEEFALHLGASVGGNPVAIHLVHDDDGAEALLKRLGEDKLGLRHGTLGGVHEEKAAVDHVEDTLHLAAEIGVAGGVDGVEVHERQGKEVYLELMVMPRSFSRALLSMRRSEAFCPPWDMRVSRSVVLPWSTCAMMAKLRTPVADSAEGGASASSADRAADVEAVNQRCRSGGDQWVPAVERSTS